MTASFCVTISNEWEYQTSSYSALSLAIGIVNVLQLNSYNLQLQFCHNMCIVVAHYWYNLQLSKDSDP